MLSIDEAISKEKEMARTFETKDFSEYHEQIAEWLKELKELRKISKKNPFLVDMIKHDKIVRNKAIDDFLEKIQWEYLNGCGIKQSEIEFLVDVSYQVAEQLKEGGENDKYKELLEIIEQKKKEVSCENCRFCDLGAYHRGQWHCKKHSVFTKPVDTMECYEKRLVKQNEQSV